MSLSLSSATSFIASDSTRSAASIRKQSVLIAVLTGSFIALRCAALTADAPLRIHGHDARELYAEPPAKSHEARNWALFGKFKLSPVDDYQFWRAQSPVWVYPLALYFRVFGTDYPQLRTFSILYAGLGFAVLLAIASRLMRTSSWVFAGLALVLDPLYFHTSRVGFIEPAVATWAICTVFALLLAERDLRWLAVAQLTCALAFFTKQAGIYLFPLVLFCTVYLGRAPEQRRKLWFVLATGALVVGLCASYVATSDYFRAVAHNVQHVLLGSEAPPDHRYRGVTSLFFRLYDAEKYQHFLLAMPISGLLAIATSIHFAARAVLAVRTRRWPAYRELVVFGWFACGLVAMAALAKSYLRFWPVVVPAGALIAGIGIDRARQALAARGAPTDRGPLAAPLIALIAWSGYGHLSYLRDSVYTVRDAARQLEARIGPRDATIVGFPSPGVVLGTPYKNFYVRGRFNAQRDLIKELGVTHLLLRQGRDATRIILNREFPNLLAGRKPDLELTTRRERLLLYDVESRLRGALGQ